MAGESCYMICCKLNAVYHVQLQVLTIYSTRIILTVKIAHNNFFAFFEDQFAFFFEDLTYLSVPIGVTVTILLIC